MTGPAISYDKVRQLPRKANTSNDSVIALIAVGASSLGQYGGLQVSHVSKKKKKAHSMVLDILVRQKEPTGPIVDIVAA